MTPTQHIEAAAAGLHHFLDNMEQYPMSALVLVNDDDIPTLVRAAEILDQMVKHKDSLRHSLNTDTAFYLRIEDGTQPPTYPRKDTP